MSKHIGNTKEFIRFVTNPSNMTSIESIYKIHGVVYERVDLYKDFTIGLNRLTQKTYMGDDISDEKIQKQHFDWCWKRSCEDFEKINVFLMDNQELYEYFKVFYNRMFYGIPDKENSDILDNIEPFWDYLFNYNHIKPHSDIDNFIDIYNKFEISFKNR